MSLFSQLKSQLKKTFFLLTIATTPKQEQIKENFIYIYIYIFTKRLKKQHVEYKIGPNWCTHANKCPIRI